MELAMILQLQLPECWGYRCPPPCLARWQDHLFKKPKWKHWGRRIFTSSQPAWARVSSNPDCTAQQDSISHPKTNRTKHAWRRLYERSMIWVSKLPDSTRRYMGRPGLCWSRRAVVVNLWQSAAVSGLSVSLKVLRGSPSLSQGIWAMVYRRVSMNVCWTKKARRIAHKDRKQCP